MNRLCSAGWLVGLGLGLIGCGGNEYAQAAGAAGFAVAATAVHRSVTGDCWGQCSKGYACNRESGLCEPGECNPKCAAGYMCSVTPTGNICSSRPQPTFNPVDPASTVSSGAPPSSMQPSSPASPERAAPTLTPDRANSGQVQIQRGNPGPADSVVFQPAPAPSASSN